MKPDNLPKIQLHTYKITSSIGESFTITSFEDINTITDKEWLYTSELGYINLDNVFAIEEVYE